MIVLIHFPRFSCVDVLIRLFLQGTSQSLVLIAGLAGGALADLVLPHSLLMSAPVMRGVQLFHDY